ncbi:MAG TPA: hypothetical protein VL651_14660 [Bacteroidia bacterium]|jgi:hypothetical protein|nr:hypothetical protein [Bacteroidia bacterium]
MAAVLKDIVLCYIEEALDIDDLENLGDFVRSVTVVENLNGWQLTEALRQLYLDLCECLQTETEYSKRLRLKSAISHFEADFSDYLITKEIGSLSLRDD